MAWGSLLMAGFGLRRVDRRWAVWTGGGTVTPSCCKPGAGSRRRPTFPVPPAS